MKFMRNTLLLIIALSVTALADQEGSNNPDTIRQQSAIASSYNFDAVPDNAGKDITVAIISQGVSSALKDRLGDRLTAVSVQAGDSDPILEGDSLGTNAVSLVAALAPHAKLVLIKAADKDGHSSVDDIKNGVIRATEQEAKIIIITLGGGFDTYPAVDAAVNAAMKKGAIVMAASGQEGEQKPGFPANIVGVIAVGAVDSDGKMASYSNYGGKTIFAPGVDILSEGNNASGTSYSVTIAGAILSVLWSQNPSLSGQQIVDAVTGSTKAMINTDGTSENKLIDAKAALEAIQKLQK